MPRFPPKRKPWKDPVIELQNLPIFDSSSDTNASASEDHDYHDTNTRKAKKVKPSRKKKLPLLKAQLRLIN